MNAAPQNRLLASLSTESQDLVLKHAVTLPAPLRMPLYEAEQEPQFAYFVTSGMASIVATTEDGDTAEVGIIGLEGVVGSLHLIGPAPVSTSAFIQLAGAVLRVLMANCGRYSAPRKRSETAFSNSSKSKRWLSAISPAATGSMKRRLGSPGGYSWHVTGRAQTNWISRRSSSA